MDILKSEIVKDMGNGAHSLQAIDATRIQLAKSAYTTRRVDKQAIVSLLSGDINPWPGDLVLAKVVKIGQHKRIELEHGRRAPLFIGDEIIICYGDRYAPDQFEAKVPSDLAECHLVAAGGIASRSLSQHGKIKAPTLIQPLGLLAGIDGKRINLSEWALPSNTSINPNPRPFIITVAGTSMNAGKTTTAAHLIKGLVRSGMKVGAAKITGTGAGGDRWLMKDAGACEVLDFTDAGFASTFRLPLEKIEDIAYRLTGHLRNNGVDAIVLEIADGLFQQETAQLLTQPAFQSSIDAIIFAAGDSMGASCGVDWLQRKGLPVIALSGCVSASTLSSREAESATGLPVMGLEQLSSAGVAVELFEQYGEPNNKRVQVG